MYVDVQKSVSSLTFIFLILLCTQKVYGIFLRIQIKNYLSQHLEALSHNILFPARYNVRINHV